ncbi:4-hydroxy-tetrahydrodipicolinate synthase, partial [Streptomyces sp. NPDC002922]
MPGADRGGGPGGAAPFGRALCAMITPFTADGDLDLDTAGKHA